MRILIADDSDIVRRGIRRILSKQNEWQVCGEASDGAETLQQTRSLRPDLVLVDVSMPVADGFETARRIRREHLDVKILIMSQEDTSSLLAGARLAGADGCLDKARIAIDLIPAVKDLQSRTPALASRSF